MDTPVKIIKLPKDRREKRLEKKQEQEAKEQARKVLDATRVDVTQRRLEEIEKERTAMLSRLALLTSKKRQELDAATKKHLRGKALTEESLIVSFVVGGVGGAAGDLTLEAKFRPSHIGKGQIPQVIMISVIRIKGKILAVRTGNNCLNPVFFVAELDEPAQAVLLRKLEYYSKAFVLVTTEAIDEYFRR